MNNIGNMFFSSFLSYAWSKVSTPSTPEPIVDTVSDADVYKKYHDKYGGSPSLSTTPDVTDIPINDMYVILPSTTPETPTVVEVPTTSTIQTAVESVTSPPELKRQPTYEYNEKELKQIDYKKKSKKDKNKKRKPTTTTPSGSKE